jgi:hypothetical protein
VTFFVTGNYLEGRPSYLGGKIGAWWSFLAQESWVGLHGLSHARGSDRWSVATWGEEQRALVNELTIRVRPPEGWQWMGYPWGSRAPQLVATEAYFTSLEQLSPPVYYDASLVVRPVSARALDVRDVPWPFTLDRELTDEVVLPFGEGASGRLALGKHSLLEVPVYAWAVMQKGELKWIPSTDLSYYEVFPCSEMPSATGLAMFEDNVLAHHRGNRAPFHLGLHAQSYAGDKKCQRATLEAMLDVLDRVGGAASKVKFEGIPPFLTRLTATP